MEVKLVAYTVNAENKDADPVSVVENAACVCYDSTPTDKYRIAKGCMKSGHKSVFEHISFTFCVEGVTRALLAQLSRHRHISLSVRSQRYCTENIKNSAVEPSAILENDYTSAVFADTIGKIAESYEIFLDNGIKAEDARSVLPNACITKLYITANARSLIESSGLRMCTRAQKEIRTMYRKMKKELEKVSPIVAEYMRPKCQTVDGYPFCTERECCGLAPRIQDVYKKE